jgi:hypothetical protein
LRDDVPVPALPTGHSIVRNLFVSGRGRVVRLQWAYPDSDPGLEWQNEVRIGAFEKTCSVEHLISINSIDYRIAPARLALGSPAVIRQLCSESAVQIGDMQVRATPYPLYTDNVDKFLELLQSPDRRLPIVFVAPYSNGDANALDASSTAQNLAGVGIVVEVRDPEATWDIAEAIGKYHSCFNGGARIYWPGFTTKEEPRSHRLYVATRIETFGPDAIARSIQRSIFSVAAFRFFPDPQISDVIREAEQTERAQRVEVQKASSGDDWEIYALELDEKLTGANQIISDLEAENRNLKANQQVFLSVGAFGEAEDEVASEEITPPESVEAAVDRARTCKNLVILDSAFDASRKSPFQRPVEVLEALHDLDDIAEDWLKRRNATGSGGDLLQHLKNRGWGKRSSMHISGTTRTKYREHYEFEYDGKRELFEPHITIGSGDPNSCASIHFHLDQTRGKIIIGHVGRHLPNTKT